MPYVTVIFDPHEISQEVVTRLKRWLRPTVARIMSETDVLIKPQSDEDIRTIPDEIMVMQMATHPTDVNVPTFEIYIQAGRPKGRSGEKIAQLLGKAVADSNLVPVEILSDGQCGIFVTFHEHNGFWFIPSHG